MRGMMVGMVAGALALSGGLAATGAVTGAPAARALFSVTAPSSVVTDGPAPSISVAASARLVWLTDRPARSSGIGTVRDLLAGWKANGFDKDPPNAVLVTRTDGRVSQVVVELDAAVIRGTRARFHYTVIPDGEQLGMATTTPPWSGRHGETSLFIDEATVTPCPSSFTGPIHCTLAAGASTAAHAAVGTSSAVSACRSGGGSSRTNLSVRVFHSPLQDGDGTAIGRYAALCPVVTAIDTASLSADGTSGKYIRITANVAVEVFSS